jgi:hypothetical protein
MTCHYFASNRTIPGCVRPIWAAVITPATASLDTLGMVMDFSQMKRVGGAWIDAHLDHRMILHEDDPVRPVLKRQGEPVFLVNVNPAAKCFLGIRRPPSFVLIMADRVMSSGIPCSHKPMPACSPAGTNHGGQHDLSKLFDARSRARARAIV